MTESLRTLTNRELFAVAALWKRSGRELVTHFTGTSMQPTIADGAGVRLLCVDDVALGDIVAYVYGDRVIVHRIVAVWDDKFVTRGDANVLPDPVPLNCGAVIGKIAVPERVTESFTARLFLKFMAVIARWFGPRTVFRLVGALRTVHRKLRVTLDSFSH